MRFFKNAISNAMLLIQDLFTSSWGDRSFNYRATLNKFRQTLDNCSYYSSAYYNAVSHNYSETTINHYQTQMQKYQREADQMVAKYSFLELEIYRYYR